MHKATRFSELGKFYQVLRMTLTPDRLLRWPLGIVYLWFGALKLLGMSAVDELIRLTYSPFAAAPLYCALAVFELALGAILLAGLWKRWAALAVMGHLLGTFGVLISSPATAFSPYFPFLTMEGEFVIKNLVLIAAACVLWLGITGEAKSHEPPRSRRWWVVGLVLVLATGLGIAGSWIHQTRRMEGIHSNAVPQAPVAMTAEEIQALIGRQKRSIVVRGQVTAYCRLLGCWLKLHGEAGNLYMNVAPAALDDVWLAPEAQVTVVGHLGQTRKGTMGFIATEVRTAQSRSSWQNRP